MIVKVVVTGDIQENCYLLIDEKTNECAIVDPGDESNKIIKQINANNLKPKYILLTHGHFDHVGAVVQLADNFNIPFYISKVDEEYMERDNSVFGTLPKANAYLKEGDILEIGNHNIKVYETPGHTKGGLCFLVEDKLFTGDTLFYGSVGRTDFLGGSMNEIVSSIKNKLLPLGDNIEVYPGHGPASTIGNEKRINPYLQ